MATASAALKAAAVSFGGAESRSRTETADREGEDMWHLRRSRSPSARVSYAGAARAGGPRDRDAGGHGLCGGDEETTESTSPRLSPCTPTDEHRDAFEYGLGSASRSHPGGGGHDCEETQQGRGSQEQAGHHQGAHWGGGRLPEPVTRVVGRSSPEHGVLHGSKNESIPMEETLVAAASEVSRGEDDRSQVEEKSTLASNVAVQGSRSSVRSLRSSSTEAEREGHSPPDVTREHQVRLQRGMIQKLKRGVALGMERAKRISEVVGMEPRYVVLEVFAGVGNLTRVAKMEMAKDWKALPPVDIIYGHDLTKKVVRDELWAVIYREEPDLITLSMPCGPWCQWMNLCPADEVDAKRTEEMPLWRLARDIWDYQNSKGRLVMTENPLSSDGLKLSFMEERPSHRRAKVAQCMMGLCDVVSGKPHRKLTALDVNKEPFAAYLEHGAHCTHLPHEHQVLEGKVRFEGRWVNRTALAGIWPTKLCRHMLRAAQKLLMEIRPTPQWSLPEAVIDRDRWEGAEVLAVSAGQVPEESMRHELQQLGAGGDRYGFITFEGEGQQVPRRIRSAVAHLHTALGHLANDRLVRMLMLSGAGEGILKAARNLRCQVCAMCSHHETLLRCRTTVRAISTSASRGTPSSFGTLRMSSMALCTLWTSSLTSTWQIVRSILTPHLQQECSVTNGTEYLDRQRSCSLTVGWSLREPWKC